MPGLCLKNRGGAADRTYEGKWMHLIVMYIVQKRLDYFLIERVANMCNIKYKII